MAEQILFNFAEKILWKLGSYALQQIGLAWGVRRELSKLENTMSTIKNVLLDAEEQQARSLAVKEWLQRLKLLVYDADDLLDEFAIVALQRQVETRGSMTRKVRYFFTRSNPLKFRFGMGRKIKDIQERLDEIALDMRNFEFAVRVVDRPFEITREETFSFVSSEEVLGRESDKEALIKLLVSSIGYKHVSIIPIVGMGGLGKTTLAQLVFNDKRVVSHFEGRLWWVCVSDHDEKFDIRRVIIRILKAVGENDCNNLGLEELQSCLRRKLRGRKFFLVLDDLWSEDCVEWSKLRDLLLMGGVRGSRIVVTTRSITVASILGTVDPYQLKGLSNNDCLSILVKWAFKEGEASKHQNLINIGREIVKKCGGVPLAARTLGGMLFLKTDECDWLSVRDNEMWALVQKKNDILPVLKLSYDQMPSYLKQCFAYCALFEKDELMLEEDLIYRWMAQGFIQSSDRNGGPEDIGECYIDELVRRSFLENTDWEGGYKMHDLVHDLAKFVAGSECLTINHHSKVIPQGVRHVSFDSNFYEEFPELLLKREKLRTILLPSNRHETFISSAETLISSFRRLRVLDFNNNAHVVGGPNLHVLLSSIGNLKHLRYLSLTSSYVMERLPTSFGSGLLNLQYLDLYGSGLCELPENFGKLINLRFLRISSKLTCLPTSIGGLNSLQNLRLVDNPELMSLGEGIQHLTGLRDFYISDCPRLASLPLSMRYLTALERLEIDDCSVLKFSEDDDLQGLRSLQSLSLFKLPGLVSLPKGLQDAAATLNLLAIWGCENLNTISESLPKLTSLQRLMLMKCPNLLSLPEGMQHLNVLRSLDITCCPSLSIRCREGAGDDWPKIAHIPEIEIDYRKIKAT